MPFHINILDKGDFLKVGLKGDLDINSSPKMSSELGEFYSKSPKNIIIDFDELDYLDSTGLGALMSIYKKAKMDDNEIKIINARQNIKKLFYITDLDREFNLED